MRRLLSLLLTLCLVLGLVACAKAPTWQEQYDLGVRYLSEGNYEEAIIAFAAAIEIEPKRAEAYVGLADVYVAQGDLEKAAAILEQGLKQAENTEQLDEKLEKLKAGTAPSLYRHSEYAVEGIEFRFQDLSDALIAVSVTGVGAAGVTKVWCEERHEGWEYDAAGRLLRQNISSPYGTLRYRVFEYNDAGQEIRNTTYNTDGSVYGYTTIEYNEAGQETWVTIYEADGTVKEHVRIP